MQSQVVEAAGGENDRCMRRLFRFRLGAPTLPIDDGQDAAHGTCCPRLSSPRGALACMG